MSLHKCVSMSFKTHNVDFFVTMNNRDLKQVDSIFMIYKYFSLAFRYI